MPVLPVDQKQRRPQAGACRHDLIRHTLRWALAVWLLALPLQAFNSVSDALSPINHLPRFALIVGNSRYSEAPLKNPANDASAIAEQLRGMGFTVTLKLDAGRQEMVDAIQSFGNNLAKQKSVGLFYFAGHGAQLAWRNYLIPVDAVIEQVSDMQTRAVDVGTLLNGLSKAGNPMNVVILDACRDNPFGKARVEQKGLSQLDAPPGTLLAYATSPGNVAADGEGRNGLYTEYLLREMQAREAKIEDVFKRVRLNVRRESEGRQIPWESTSLEEDFYFLPPAQIRKLTPEEIERQFEEELGIWEKIKGAKDAAPLEDYLRRFPSGRFSELAQFRLDRLLAQQEKPVQVASVAPAPAAAGSSSLAQKPAAPVSATAEADRKRQEELARAEAELKKQQELAKAEAARKQQEEIARAETERKRQDALAKAEAERKRLEELARAEAERRKKEDLAKAEAERKRQEELARAEAEVRKQQELAKAEADRKRQEELARAEAELKKQQELAKAEAARQQQEEVARAETERKRQDALAKAEAERKRLEELARAEAERRKKEDLARAETERKRQEELARAEAEVRKQQELAKAEAGRTRQEELARAEPVTPAPIAPTHVASIAPNPYSKGSARANADYKIGDSYSYQVIDFLTKLETRRYTNTVRAVSDFDVTFGGGRVTDLLGNDIKLPNGRLLSPSQYFPAEYAVGKKWSTRYRWRRGSGDGVEDVIEMDLKIVGREEITVPAGTFNAFKIEGRGFVIGAGTQQIFNFWVDPEMRRPIVLEFLARRGSRFVGTDRHELVSFKQRD
jgi:uncharacterized caspase-like protein